MQYTCIPPPPQLAAYIRAFWVLESDAGYIHRHYADGSAEMIFHYKGRFEELTENKATSQYNAMIHAQSSHHRRFATSKAFGIFGVYLYPFAIPLLCKMPASDLANQLPDLVTLFGQDGRILEEQMMQAADNNTRISIITSFLEKRLLKAHNTEPAIAYCINNIIHSNGIISVPAMAANCFLSLRQFERKFKAYAGFAPKLYTRITRFQYAMKKYGSNFPSLTQVAYDCGYYDQSHFIHDFKSFSGYQPGEYFYGNAEGTEWRTV